MGVQINGDTGNISATKADYSGNVTIGGTLTYEDVTNIDSVGLITAREGIEIGARPGVAASISVDGNAIFSGITTATTIKSTTGIVTTLTSTTLNVDGGDATFTGASANIIFDKSDDALEFNDDAKATFGTGADTTLTHSGADFAITNTTGNLNILNNSAEAVQIRHGSETMIKAVSDGAVELYHDNSKKLETTSTGISVTGSVSVTTEPAFRAGLTANVSISHNNNFTVPFDTDSGDGLFDTNSCFDTSNYRFTPNLAGYYHLHFVGRLDLPSADHLYQARIRENGNDIIAINQNFNKSGNDNSSVQISCLFYFNGSSDYVTAELYQNSGSTSTVYGGTTYHYQTFFEGHFVRSA